LFTPPICLIITSWRHQVQHRRLPRPSLNIK